MEKQKSQNNVGLSIFGAPSYGQQEADVRIPVYFRFAFDAKGRLICRSTVFSFFIYNERIIFIEPTVKNASQ
ncbi:hypothetical protein HY622_01295 [Candidatus Uhrbacteria bacterium]|nr:hypothetical protein [Candidatus Uhrbacteria bacterium]